LGIARQICPIKGKKQLKQYIPESLLLIITIVKLIFIILQRTLPQKAFGCWWRDLFILRRRLQAFVIRIQNFAHFDPGMMNSNQDVLLMCIYIHPCPALTKQRGAADVVHIGVGFLRCSFSG